MLLPRFKNLLAIGLMVLGGLTCLFSPAWVRFLPSNPYNSLRLVEPSQEANATYTFANSSTSAMIVIEHGYETHAIAAAIGVERLRDIPPDEFEVSVTTRCGFPFLSGRHTKIESYWQYDPARGSSLSCRGGGPRLRPLRTSEFRAWSVPLSTANAFTGSLLGYAVAFPIAAAGPIIRRLRRRKGHCQCGYQVLDLSRCPECGEENRGDPEPLKVLMPWHRQNRMTAACCIVAALTCVFSPLVLRPLASEPPLFNLKNSEKAPTNVELNFPLFLRTNTPMYGLGFYSMSMKYIETICPSHIKSSEVNDIRQTSYGFPVRSATFSRIAYVSTNGRGDRFQLWHDTVKFNAVPTAINAAAGMYLGFIASRTLAGISMATRWICTMVDR